jgi:hypothetical protein
MVLILVFVLVVVVVRFSRDTSEPPIISFLHPPGSPIQDDHDHDDEEECQEEYDDDENETLNRYRVMLSPITSPLPLKPSFSR